MKTYHTNVVCKDLLNVFFGTKPEYDYEKAKEQYKAIRDKFSGEYTVALFAEENVNRVDIIEIR